MEQVFRILWSIELFSNNKSFKIGINRSVENLWILNHLNHLEIKKQKIRYKRNYGPRQGKNTNYPNRWLKKKFKNTSELINYLYGKPYDISVFELEFTNNWRVKVGMYIHLNFYTNSTKERNDLIKKILLIEGIKTSSTAIKKLKNNYTYWVELNNDFIVLPESYMPDEFWAEEMVQNWRRKARKKNYKRLE